MPLRLRHTRPIAPYLNGYDLDRNPSPTITAGGVTALGGSYWLELDVPLRLRHARPIAPQLDGLDLDRHAIPTITTKGVSFLGNYWLEMDVPLRLRHKAAINAAQNGLNLDRAPAPTITAGGLSVIGDYWLEVDVVDSYKPDPSKPPYRVPSMAEINATPWNGLNVVSTFSGAGGSCLGYRMAGYKILWASEFVPAAAEVYRANHPTSILDTRDIREFGADEILAALGMNAGDIDLLDGSPPCASFSTAGKRQKHWGQVRNYSDVEQRTDDLFLEFARILEGLQPKVFVAENVSGLVKGAAKGYFKLILARLKAAGYRVRAQLLDAQWLGVPQARQRVFFVGVRNDLHREPVFPPPLPYRYSVRDAIPWLQRFTTGINPAAGTETVVGRREHPTSAPSPAIMATGVAGSFASQHRVEGEPPVEPESSMEGYATGRAWEKIGGVGASARYYQLIRPDPHHPSPTITAAGGNPGLASVAHPHDKRKFSIAELRRLCAFPDDFILTGTYSQQWERLGRAVPPVMMRAVAETIRDEVLLCDRTDAG